VRRRLTWLVTVPLGLAGIEAAHALANAAFGSPAEGGELFADARSGAGLLPLAGALALASVVPGLAARAARPGGPRARALPFALLPPIGFVALETIESLLHSGALPAVSATLVAGLALQAPFALAGYLAARALLRLGDRAGRLLAELRPAPLRPAPVAPPRDLLSRRAPVSCRPHARSGRAPPASPLPV
jgi:hypothetical protein